MVIKTGGIRHVHLLVRDLGRAVDFYCSVFGMTEDFREGNIVFLSTPGAGDDLALHLAITENEKQRVGTSGGVEHFGMYVSDRSLLDEAIAAVVDAGGSLVDRGQHAPGVPYAYVKDLDGYLIEI